MPLQEELDQVLTHARLSPLFQPIVTCTQATIFGYEALIRGPSASPLHAPVNLFTTAIRFGRLTELDQACRRAAIREFGRLGLPGYLFVNVNPATLATSDFSPGRTAAYLDEAGLAPERVVIELTEQLPIHDYGIVRAAADHYRTAGFSTAIDDLGAGYSSLRHWAELQPDYVKLDRNFIQGLDQDRGKRQFLRSILDMSDDLGCRVVAEGIETAAEYASLCRIGLELGQGYFFARPQANPPRTIVDLPSFPGGGRAPFSEPVKELARPVPTVAPEATVAEVTALFELMPSLRNVPVLEKERPRGLIRRDELQARLSGRGTGDPPLRAADLARAPAVVIAEDALLDKLIQRLAATDSLVGDEDILVVDAQGRLLGACTILDLLRRITELGYRGGGRKEAGPQLGGSLMQIA